MVIKSDEFNGTGLNTSLWTITDPRNDATFSVINGALSISVPYGVSHDLWGVNNVARVMQNHDNTDFEVEAKLNSIPSQQYQIQGILVEQDTNNYLRFDFVSTGYNIRVFSAKIINGSPTKTQGDLYIPSTQTVLYMRVKKAGNDWTYIYSTDGITWNLAITFNQILTASKVGVYGGNHGIPETISPQYTALIDYFKNTQAPPPPPPLTPVAYWKFDETSGSNILDTSGNGYDGIIYGGTTRVPGLVGNALKFDGIYGSYANIKTETLTKSLPSGLSPRSISSWINVSEYTPESFIFFYGTNSNKNAFYITIFGSEVRGGAWDTTLGDIVYPNFFSSLNTWYHVCLTYDGTTAILYGNGIELGRKAATDWNLISRTEGGYINMDWQALSPFKGLVDELKIFDKALSSTEVLQDYNSITPPTCNPLICKILV